MALFVRIASILLLVSGLLPLGSRPATAQGTALTASAPPASMIIGTPVAGSQPSAVIASATYFVKVKNVAGVKKITASLDANMPIGTSLTIDLAPSAGATSLGAVSLSVTTQDVVVNIARENGSTLGITYTFTATVAAGVLPSQTRTVTLTLLNYP